MMGDEQTPTRGKAQRSMGEHAARWVRAALTRAAVFALLWTGLAGWDWDQGVYGGLGVAAATAASLLLAPPPPCPPLRRWPRRCWAGVVLTLWFTRQTVAGGVDVSLRALRRAVDVEPVVLRAPLRLPEGRARELALLMMNLMPGSMIQRTLDDEVEIHTLSPRMAPQMLWHQLQGKVASAVGGDSLPQ